MMRRTDNLLDTNLFERTLLQTKISLVSIRQFGFDLTLLALKS